MDDLDICQEYFKVWQEMEGDIDLSVSIGKVRKHENCVRPSQFKRKSVDTQIKYFFDPLLLEEAGVIDYSQAVSLFNSSQLDASGKLNVTLGTIIHSIILPKLESNLRNLGINAVTEYPLISRELACLGTADLLIFKDSDKLIDIYDLKTTGPGMLKKCKESSIEYKLQLLSYGLMLEDIFNDYKVDKCCIIYACKTPRSKVTEMYDGELVEYQLPLVDIYTTTLDEIKKERISNRGNKTLLDFFFSCSDEVKKINSILVKKIKGYNHWLFDDGLWELKLDKLSKELEDRE